MEYHDNNLIDNSDIYTTYEDKTVVPHEPKLILESNSEVLDMFNRMGFSINNLGVIDDGASLYVYDELIESFDNYYKMLIDTESTAHLIPQLKIDYLISLAIDIKTREHNGEVITDKEKYIAKAVKDALVTKMKDNNPLVIGTKVFENPDYAKVLFDDLDSMNVYKGYLSYVTDKVDLLINKFKIISRDPFKYDDNYMMYRDRILLYKALESGLFDDKYKEQIEVIDTILLYKAEYEDDEETIRVESEYLIVKAAKNKCRVNNIPYRKLYFSDYSYSDKKIPGEMCNSDEYMHGVSGRFDGNILVVAPKSQVYKRLHILLHEYEHLIQRTKNNSGTLDMAALSDVFCDLLRWLLSKPEEKYDEYSANYDIKTNEIFANEIAKREYNELLSSHGIKPNTNRKIDLQLPVRKKFLNSKRKDTISAKEKELYYEAVAKKFARDINDNEYTLHMYNVIMTGKLLEKFPEKLEEFPLLKHFFNQEKGRLKNLQELSSDYQKQDVNGRNTFSSFVEYQVINGDLDNVDLSTMSRIDRLSFMLMITRSITNLISRFAIAFNNGIEQNGKIEQELVAILNKELDFIKNNSKYITEIHELINSSGNYIEGIINGNRTTLSNEEKEIIERQMRYEHQSFDNDIETSLQINERIKLKTNVLEYQSNPLYLLDLYSKYKIEELIIFSLDGIDKEPNTFNIDDNNFRLSEIIIQNYE